MTREILFKAKRLSDGEWLEGSIVNAPADADFMPGAYILPRLTSARVELSIKGIMLGGFFEVDPSTVCEYTGLTDKNGKKIFEGDVVRAKYSDCGEDREEIVTVNWNAEDASFSPWNWEYVCDGCDCSCEIESIEIIGNIHDGEGGQHDGVD